MHEVNICNESHDTSQVRIYQNFIPDGNQHFFPVLSRNELIPADFIVNLS